MTLVLLRKLGLAAVLQHAEDGYRLDPEWLVVRRHSTRSSAGSTSLE